MLMVELYSPYLPHLVASHFICYHGLAIGALASLLLTDAALIWKSRHHCSFTMDNHSGFFLCVKLVVGKGILLVLKEFLKEFYNSADPEGWYKTPSR